MLAETLLNKRIIAIKWDDDTEFAIAVEDGDGEVSIVRLWVDTEDSYYTKLEAEVTYPLSIRGGWIIYRPEDDGTAKSEKGNK